jgi:cell wall-associated NlpC family hydrolase
MKFFKNVGLTVCFVFFAVSIASPTLAQDRSRVVKTTSSRPINQPTVTSAPLVKTLSSSKPVLTNEPVVQKPLVEKTGITSPVAAITSIAGRALNYTSSTSTQMLGAITSRFGLRYVYGATGPNTYDCSGFVWQVFKDAGFKFDRSSAASYWSEFEPVIGDDRFKFGTLVFFNGLGHVGIVADNEGFYHASSSKGITYSKFEGYWEKRITGFRKVPAALLPTPPAVPMLAEAK